MVPSAIPQGRPRVRDPRTEKPLRCTGARRAGEGRDECRPLSRGVGDAGAHEGAPSSAQGSSRRGRLGYGNGARRADHQGIRLDRGDADTSKATPSWHDRAAQEVAHPPK
jgi:hypothetical protein